MKVQGNKRQSEVSEMVKKELEALNFGQVD